MRWFSSCFFSFFLFDIVGDVAVSSNYYASASEVTGSIKTTDNPLLLQGPKRLKPFSPSVAASAAAAAEESDVVVVVEPDGADHIPSPSPSVE